MTAGPSGSFVAYIDLSDEQIRSINDCYYDNDFGTMMPIPVSLESLTTNYKTVLTEEQLHDLRAVVVPADAFNNVGDLRYFILAMLNGVLAPIYLHVKGVGLFKLTDQLYVDINGV